jgi:6-pyruvoyltetrahydropterin/6-carboxytetrahydropterin synthase
MPSTAITRRYHFESAHFLPRVPDGHKCKRMHGHNYETEITVEGTLNDAGFIIDFWDLDKYVQPLIDGIDHQTLNNIPGLENPTAEHIAAWIMLNLQRRLPNEIGRIVAVRIYETKDCWADVF